jgi:hypothetical protein
MYKSDEVSSIYVLLKVAVLLVLMEPTKSFQDSEVHVRS